jgi:hypothetical protein
MNNEIVFMVLEYNYLKIKQSSASENGTWKNNSIARTSCSLFQTIKKLYYLQTPTKILLQRHFLLQHFNVDTYAVNYLPKSNQNTWNEFQWSETSKLFHARNLVGKIIHCKKGMVHLSSILMVFLCS